VLEKFLFNYYNEQRQNISPWKIINKPKLVGFNHPKIAVTKGKGRCVSG